ncbi:MAG: glycosyltransferase family 39 protein [Patescibacteria group bacterium]
MERLLKGRYIILILILGLILRLVSINQSLWLDEAIGALVVKEQSYTQIATTFPLSDNHPPLYYLTLKAWADIFGYSELSLRFPSIIFGLGTVLLVYLIGKKIMPGKKGRFPEIAALLLATSQFHIYYSQEARMYVMAGFFASLAVFSFLFLSQKSGKKTVSPLWWALFSLSLAAIIFTDYVPIFLLPIFWVWTLYKKPNGKWWVNFVLAHLPLVLLGIFWLPTLIHQAERGRWLLSTLPAWREVAGGASFKQAALVWMKFSLGRITFANKVFYYSLVILGSIPFAIAGVAAWVKRKRIEIFWMWLLVPLILGFTTSFIFPVFIYFRFTYVIPAFFLIIAWGVFQAKTQNLRMFLIVSLIAVNLVGWLIYVIDKNQQREHWRQAVDFVELIGKEDEIVIFEFPEPFAPYRWYAKGKVEAVGVTDSISANEKETKQKTIEKVSDKNGVYYFEYLRDLSDPNQYVQRALADLDFKVSGVYDFFPGIGQITYFVRP